MKGATGGDGVVDVIVGCGWYGAGMISVLEFGEHC